MAKQTIPTRALLACGAVAGPLYVTVTMAQALTRDGFDLRQHRFTLLTTGDLGWIHQSNMLLVGVLTVLLAVGVRQMVRTGRGAVWGPRLLGLFGVAYIIGGVLTADPVTGFPRTAVMLATDPKLEGETGGYYRSGRKRERPLAFDAEVSDRLWRVGAELTRVDL